MRKTRDTYLFFFEIYEADGCNKTEELDLTGVMRLKIIGLPFLSFVLPKRRMLRSDF